MDKTRTCCTCKHKSKAMCQYPCIECFGWNKHEPNPLPQTNADRIRNMTDEELALVIMCPYDNLPGECTCEEDDSRANCIKCCLEWLQAEVEEGENDG